MIINMETAALDDTARARFYEICGPGRFPAKAEETRLALRAKIAARGVYSLYAPARPADGTLELDGVRFSCPAFPSGPGWLRVCAYILTIGDIEIPAPDIFERYLADVWGTAYAEAALARLRAVLSEAAAMELNAGELFASPSYGPGIFGMDISEIRGLFAVLDGPGIGVTLTESGFMLPQKSLAGLIFFGDERAAPGRAWDCAGCASRRKNCEYCAASRQGV